ncbi:TIGR03618 family F420-dependent PPOX class oxidoreductase [Streptomyces sp. TRM66268-LWL]|uniref:TIGR03618 family F420-dependent PPOX class oxidoreductase n=1 Tax=Streptomyces polyasparticus TaxID=2767826 RepID=A0ABR7SG20_9ACTN|nr:TIGR03618 family F420-dependent PPOX class oxidoreductase [Streptomyces polyasparticus]MBC9714442.1 TIGR03618 family F420-dependent PPOX class oxidoreductase [Streptomyces polyasparticus]
MAIDPHHPDAAYLSFWRERHMCTLTTLRPDGTPHVVPVGATYDPDAGVARVITNKSSTKVSNILAAGAAGARVALCQVDGGRWATLEGIAHIRTDAAQIADAVERYATRYTRTPAPNPDRVLIEVVLSRAMGRA